MIIVVYLRAKVLIICRVTKLCLLFSLAFLLYGLYRQAKNKNDNILLHKDQIILSEKT